MIAPSHTDDDLAAALQLLAEAADYLLRLPPVPATRHLAGRLRRHLATPAARQAVYVPALVLSGRGPYTAAGVPLIEATLREGGELELNVPAGLHGATRDYARRELMRAIERGPVRLCLSA